MEENEFIKTIQWLLNDSNQKDWLVLSIILFIVAIIILVLSI
jgi:hypothetical protein